jgi:putative Mg2+ transporter-C (MgtC) family protein
MDIISTPDALPQLAFRLILALVLGGVVGVNRELMNKPAGLRTHALVALGAAVLCIIALGLGRPTTEAQVAAASRVVQGIIAGVGFIGGGAILRHEPDGVHGVTTAASIWLVAAIGMTVGLGMWRTALLASALTAATLMVGEALDRWLRRGRRGPGN